MKKSPASSACWTIIRVKFIFHSLSTDTELMLFAFRFLRQTMFGEESIKMKADTFDKRLARKKERDAAAGETSGE